MPAPQRHITATDPDTRGLRTAKRVVVAIGGVVVVAIGFVIAGIASLVVGLVSAVILIGAGRVEDVVVLGVGAVVILGVIGAFNIWGVGDRSARWRNPDSRRAVRVAARLLPASRRKDYLEEWATWMLDMRLDGVPWHRRLIEVMTIVLIAAPQLAVTLRLRPRRSVDR